MGLFSFLNKKESTLPVLEDKSEDTNVGSLQDKTDIETTRPAHIKNTTNHLENNTSPEIQEHIFVEYEKPKTKSLMEPNEPTQEVNNLQTLYRYLEQNLEKKGYEDALMNPDTSYRDEHVKYIQNELSLMISKVKTYYNSHLRTIDLHIETRKRGGMLELVDELVSERQIVEDELNIVSQIDQDSQNANGLTENLFLSYKKGFKNGFAAITYNTVLKRS